MADNITVQQRMLNFSALTRQHMHMVGKQTTNTEYSTLSFVLPKARLLSKTTLLCEFTLQSALAANATYLQACKSIDKIIMDLNNGFMPVSLSGFEAGLYSCVATHPQKCMGTTGLVKTSADKKKVTFAIELQNTLNDSMLQGLILLQNNATQVNVNVNIANGAKVASGNTITSFTITPMIETFTIPSDARAFPDISVIKLMQAKTVDFTSGGENTVYLDTGMIYRKIIFYLTDANGNALKPENLTGNIELNFNTADTPYSISPEMLQFMNCNEFGERMPEGMYVFDFSSQSPLIGYGGSRDYIDTEKLTTFTMKFNYANASKVTVISETLSRLI